MEITLNWSEPSPTPLCGYVVEYKPFGGGVYQTIFCQNNTPLPAGSQLGPPLDITNLQVGSYEGRIFPECCSSQGDVIPWCVNPWNRFRITDTPVQHGTINEASNLVFIAYNKQLPVPYPIMVTGTFHYTCGGVPGSINFETVIAPMQMSSPQWPLYPAGTMTPTGPSAPQINIPCSSTILYTLSTNLTNVAIRRYDTTQYNYINGMLPKDHAKPFWSPLSTTPAPTWGGRPTVLPSFSLTNYNIVSGGATISWMQTAGATLACGNYIFEIKSADGATSYGSTAPIPIDATLGWHTYNVTFDTFIPDGVPLKIITKFSGGGCAAGGDCYFVFP